MKRLRNIKTLLIIVSIFSILGCANPNNVEKKSDNIVKNEQESVNQVEMTDIPTAEEVKQANNNSGKAEAVVSAFSGEKVWKASIPTGAGATTDICLKITDSANKTMTVKIGEEATKTYNFIVTEQNWIILTTSNDENDYQTIKFKGNSGDSKDVAMVIPAKLIDPEASANAGYEVSFKESNETEIPSTKPDQGKEPNTKPEGGKDPITPNPSNPEDNGGSSPETGGGDNGNGEIEIPQETLYANYDIAALKQLFNNLKTYKVKYTENTNQRLSVNEVTIDFTDEGFKIGETAIKVNYKKAEEKVDKSNGETFIIADVNISNKTNNIIQSGDYYIFYEKKADESVEIYILDKKFFPSSSSVGSGGSGSNDIKLSNNILKYFLVNFPFENNAAFQHPKGKMHFENYGVLKFYDKKIVIPNKNVSANYIIHNSKWSYNHLVANITILDSSNIDIIANGESTIDIWNDSIQFRFEENVGAIGVVPKDMKVPGTPTTVDVFNNSLKKIIDAPVIGTDGGPLGNVSFDTQKNIIYLSQGADGSNPQDIAKYTILDTCKVTNGDNENYDQAAIQIRESYVDYIIKDEYYIIDVRSVDNNTYKASVFLKQLNEKPIFAKFQ